MKEIIMCSDIKIKKFSENEVQFSRESYIKTNAALIWYYCN